MNKKTLKELLEMAKNYKYEDCYRDILVDYKLDDETEIIGPFFHRYLAGHAARLANAVVENGGTEAEVGDALMYLLVALDVRKYNLDYKRFAKDYNIERLEKKYLKKNEFSMFVKDEESGVLEKVT